jgi:hypothetical protein
MVVAGGREFGLRPLPDVEFDDPQIARIIRRSHLRSATAAPG